MPKARCIVNRIVVFSFVISGLLLASRAEANLATEVDAAKKKQAAPQEKLAWRGSAFLYENVVATRSFDKGLLPDWNPYHAMLFSFQPRYYLRDDFSVRMRLNVEVETTTPDELDYRGEAVLYDLDLSFHYSPSWLTIPVVGIRVLPTVRISLPTSPFSQMRSRIMALAPGFSLLKSFSLLSGDWLPSVTLLYGFRGTKYFDQYALAQVDLREGCQNSSQPSCQHQGYRNTSWRVSNSLALELAIHKQVTFGFTFLYNSDFKHELPEYVFTSDNLTQPETFAVSEVNYSASMLSAFELGYTPTNWLLLSLGMTTYVPVIAPTGDSYNPLLFKKEDTQVYFDVRVTIDTLYQAATGWFS